MVKSSNDSICLLHYFKSSIFMLALKLWSLIDSFHLRCEEYCKYNNDCIVLGNVERIDSLHHILLIILTEIFLAYNGCASSPCLNNGNCTNQKASYTCSCAQGYSGTHCKESMAITIVLINIEDLPCNAEQYLL